MNIATYNCFGLYCRLFFRAASLNILDLDQYVVLRSVVDCIDLYKCVYGAEV